REEEGAAERNRLLRLGRLGRGEEIDDERGPGRTAVGDPELAPVHVVRCGEENTIAERDQRSRRPEGPLALLEHLVGTALGPVAAPKRVAEAARVGREEKDTADRR